MLMGDAADQIDSETTKTGQRQVSNYFDPPQRKPDDPAILKGTLELSEEYTTTDFISDSKARFEAESWSENFVQRTSGPLNTVAYQFHNQCGSSNYGVQKVQLKIVWGSMVQEEDRYTGNYVILFTPVDDPTTTEDESENLEIVGDPITFNTTTESDVYTIDPLKLNNDKLGSYSLISVDITPDFDRDGQIDADDKGKITTDKPFRWWINDDDDSEDAKGSDISGDGTADHSNNIVDGVRDLNDFFPLYLDLGNLLTTMEKDKFEYRLKHSESALKFFITDMNNGSATLSTRADAYLQDQGYAESLGLKTTFDLDNTDGYKLPNSFLEKIENSTGGVILVEATKATTKPLVLEIRNQENGNKVMEFEFPLSISPVEDMFAHKNIHIFDKDVPDRHLSGPPNYPDSETNGKEFVMVHGYNVNQQQARGWAAETFKRLYVSGSKAKYTAISWTGAETQIAAAGFTPDYHENVINAFVLSESLANFVNGKNAVIAAHSLGNMIVSSAIVDHGMNVDSYYMLDAAVAREAYEGSRTAQEISDMTHPHWDGYDQKLLSGNWYNLFKDGALDSSGNPVTGDNRYDLRWLDRFGIILNAYNFYSSGEEVLDNNDGTVPLLQPGNPTLLGDLAWAHQELHKGDEIIELLSGDRHGGWFFNLQNDDYRITAVQPLPPSSAALLTPLQLAEDSFFLRFQEDDNKYLAYKGLELYGEPGDLTASLQAGQYETRAKVIAEAVPALSYAAGRNNMASFSTPSSDRNHDINILYKNGWGASRGGQNRWLHSDARNMAYLYTFKLFEKWIELGGLDNE
jgi:hypothetical protein